MVSNIDKTSIILMCMIILCAIITIIATIVTGIVSIPGMVICNFIIILLAVVRIIDEVIRSKYE